MTFVTKLFARQTDPALIADEAAPNMAAIAELMQSFPKLNAITDHTERMRAVGQMALNATTVAPEIRRAMIERRLSGHDWPEAALTITAVEVESGALVTFDASSGVSLVDAVSASCAVPGVWPVVAIGGKHYVDGGAYSVDNAHLAAGAKRVIIASPFGTVSPAPNGYHVNDAVAALEVAGSKVLVIEPDDAMQCFGGMGMTKESPLPLLAGRIRTMRIYDGPSEVHRMVVARNLMDTRA